MASDQCYTRDEAGYTDLSQVQTGTVTAIVVIAIHVQNIFALNRQETRQNTLRQTRTKDDDLYVRPVNESWVTHRDCSYIVLFIHDS